VPTTKGKRTNNRRSGNAAGRVVVNCTEIYKPSTILVPSPPFFIITTITVCCPQLHKQREMCGCAKQCGSSP
jgi:hypothetical protein